MEKIKFKKGDRVVYTNSQGDGPLVHKIGTTGVVDKISMGYLYVLWDKDQRNNDGESVTGINSLYTYRFELINKTDHYEIY